MKRMMTMSARSTFGVAAVVAAVRSYLEATMESVAGVFSAILEEEVTPRQARCLLNAALALTTCLLCAALPLVLRFAAFAWLFSALRNCRRAGLGEA